MWEIFFTSYVFLLVANSSKNIMGTSVHFQHEEQAEKEFKFETI